MGFLLTRATCPCGSFAESGDDNYIWRLQHTNPVGDWCTYFTDGKL